MRCLLSYFLYIVHSMFFILFCCLLQAIFPVSLLLSRGLKFPIGHEEVLMQYNSFPYLSTVEQEVSEAGIRKVHLELNLG